MSINNQGNVDNEHWAIKLVSQYRLSAYLQANGDDIDAALEGYVSDAAAAGNLMVWLHLAEVSLRNALTRELDAEYGKSGGGWMPIAQNLIDSDALIAFRKTTARIQSSGKSLSATTVTSNLPFGFWVKLLGRRYESTLWTRALHKAFTGETKPSRSTVYDCVNGIYNLRNRVAHHEFVPKSNFAGHKGEVLKLLAWVSPEGATWAQNSIKP